MLLRGFGWAPTLASHRRVDPDNVAMGAYPNKVQPTATVCPRLRAPVQAKVREFVQAKRSVAGLGLSMRALTDPASLERQP